MATGEPCPRALVVVPANIVSTILASIIGIIADLVLMGASGTMGMSGNRVAVLVSLVPMFLLTWWLETMAVRGLQPLGAAHSAKRATLMANAVAYLFLAIAVLVWPNPSLDFPRGEARWRLAEAIMAMGAAKNEVNEYFVAHKRFPEPKSIPATVKYLRSLRLEKDGRLVSKISSAGRGSRRRAPGHGAARGIGGDRGVGMPYTRRR